jgi:hypothetical protein
LVPLRFVSFCVFFFFCFVLFCVGCYVHRHRQCPNLCPYPTYGNSCPCP